MNSESTSAVYHGTTIVSCGGRRRPAGRLPLAATARSRWATPSSRVRRAKVALYREQVLAGFAIATADAFTLFERFEAKLEKHQATSCARR